MKKSLLTMLLLFGATAAYGEIYTWKDARGTKHYTNSLHEIPARFLKKARVLDVATGKVGRLATAQPSQPAPNLSQSNAAATPLALPMQRTAVQQPSLQQNFQPAQQAAAAPPAPVAPGVPVATPATPAPSAPAPAALRYPTPTASAGAGTAVPIPQPGRRRYGGRHRGAVVEE